MFKKDTLKLVIVASFSIILLLFLWNFIDHTNYYYSIINLFKFFSGKLIELISGLTNSPVTYLATTQKLVSSTHTWEIVIPLKAFPVFTALLTTVFVLPLRKYYHVFLFFISTTIFLIARTIIIMLFRIYLTGTIHNIWLLWIDSTIYLPAFCWVNYLVKNNNVLLFYSIKTNTVIIRNSYMTIKQIVLLLILVTPLPRILLTYMGNSLEGLTTLLLSTSKGILKVFGYNAAITGRTLFIDNNWLRLEPTCIGIGVWTIVLLLILVMRGNIINKVLFILGFSFIFLLTNSLRLALTLDYIHSVYGHHLIMFTRVHNIITYVMYVVSFILLYIYIFWFNDLNLHHKKMPK